MPSDRPSNLDKVFWPDAGLTKGDLLGYLEAVAPVMLPELRDRPLTLKRYPDGIDAFSFFQKNTPSHAPSFVKTVRIHAGSSKRDVDYTVCNSSRTLLWLGNQAAIEFHPWISRVDRLDRPDVMVFDFDPPDGGFDAAVEAAIAMGEVMEEAGVAGAPKTSGSKGIHIYVPLRRRHGFGAVAHAAERLGQRLVERLPDLTTMEFSKAARGGRVLVDVRRNAPAQHTVAPYSPRARPGGTVSFPIRWSDLGRVRIEDFTIRTVPKLLDGGAPAWRDLLPPAQSIPAELLRD